MTIGPSDGIVRAAARFRGRHPPRPHQGRAGTDRLCRRVDAQYTAYASVETARDLIVTNYRLWPPGWRAGQRLTITVIADLHAGGTNMGIERLRQVVDAGNALGSDSSSRLTAPLGVHAILGNHDWWYDIVGVRKALADVRMPVMENEAILLGEKGRRFWLAGLCDQLAYIIEPGKFRGVGDLPSTLKHVTTDDPVILLVHELDIFTQVPERVALTIAGHTHGG
jgi:hypothetical protein